jgi:hypothetical protein
MNGKEPGGYAEGDFQDLLNEVLAQPRGKRSAALESSIFPLSGLVAHEGLNLIVALDGFHRVGRELGLDDIRLQDLTTRLFRAIDTPPPGQNGKAGSKKIGHDLDLYSVKPQPTEWVWLNRIPAGEVTVVEGRKATGKSTLVGDIAVRKASGHEMPDGMPSAKGNVLYLCGEESISRTVRRRVGRQLEKYGYCLEPGQFTILDTVETDDGKKRGYEIPGDLELIDEKVQAYDAVLLIIDVLDNFLGDKIDTHSNHSVRRALGPLAVMAQKLDIAVITIRHLRKGQQGLAIDQGLGSVGIGGQARSILRADHHPDREDQRVLAHVANNVGPIAPTLGYVMEVTEDELGHLAIVKWTGPEDMTADDLAAAQPGRAKESKAAQEWLEDLLEQHQGRVTSVEVQGLARDEDGFSLRTLKKIKKKMGVRSKLEYERSPDGKVVKPVWFWIDRSNHQDRPDDSFDEPEDPK